MTEIASVQTFHPLKNWQAFSQKQFKSPLVLSMVLGSGLGGFTQTLSSQGFCALPYDSIPGFPKPQVSGHSGVLYLGHWQNPQGHTLPIAVFSGRFHMYEGHSLSHVTLPVKLSRLLGARHMLLTNAAGGVNPTFAPGTLMLITDHLNLSGQNPLMGPLDQHLGHNMGERFPDMTQAYHPNWQAMVRAVADEQQQALSQGVYAWLSGPNYETPAEIRMLQTLGADAVGMSTVPETLMARQFGMAVLGLSCITNAAAGISKAPLSHQEVLETGQKTAEQFSRLLSGILNQAATQAALSQSSSASPEPSGLVWTPDPIILP